MVTVLLFSPTQPPSAALAARLALAGLLLLALVSACRGTGALDDCSGAISWDEAWKYSNPRPGPDQWPEEKEYVVRGPVMNTLAGGGEYGDVLFVGRRGPSSWGGRLTLSPAELNPDGSPKAFVVWIPPEAPESSYEGRTICVRGVIRSFPKGDQSYFGTWTSIGAWGLDDVLVEE